MSISSILYCIFSPIRRAVQRQGKSLSPLRLGLTLTLLLAAFMTTSCNRGSSAIPPAGGISVLAGENRATVSWTTVPGVEYWVFYAPTDNITTSNWLSIPGSHVIEPATSPLVVPGLVNGTTYSFTLNARISGGPGGAGTPSISIVPRMAGDVWDAGNATGSNDLRAVISGVAYVAAGANGAMYTSSDALAWKPVNFATSNSLYGLAYTGAYMAVGANGTMLYSTDTLTWAVEPTGTTNNLYAIANNSANLLVAVGANGTIIYSSNGISWSNAVNSATTKDLYHVVYSALNGGTWVAVGANGTIVTSSDGMNWQAAASNTVADLKGICYGFRDSSIGTSTFVAVGSAGTVLSSTDGTTWTSQTPLLASNLNAVTYGLQFVAVGDKGAVFTSTNGSSWTAQSSNSASNLYGIVHSPSGYSAVGSGGTDLFAQ
jgi:hypothetical protein